MLNFTGLSSFLVRIYHNLIWFLLKSPWWNDLDCGFCAISLRKQRSKITSEKRSERTLQHEIGTRVTKIRGPKKGSFFIRRNANGKIENHLPMSWTLLNAILSSALRQKSRVLRNKPFIRNAIVSKSNNNPLVILMFVLVTVLKTRTRHSIDSLLGILLIAHETITIIYLGSFSTPDFPPN